MSSRSLPSRRSGAPSSTVRAEGSPRSPAPARSARRGALVTAALVAVGAAAPALARPGIRPELVQGDWALLVDGDRAERAVSIATPVVLPAGLRFEASVFEGRRGRPAMGSVRDDAGAAVLSLPAPGLGQLTLRQKGAERWEGVLLTPLGASRAARIVRYVPGEPASLPIARQTALRPDSRVRVLYFGAEDCVYCRSWEGPASLEGAFLGSDAARRVELVKVKRARTVFPPGVDALPPDLRARVPADPRLSTFLAAAPGWLVVVDDDVVLGRTGLSAWSREVEPFVAVLAQRLGGH